MLLLNLAGYGQIGYDVDCEGVDYCVRLEMMGSRQMLLIEVGDGGQWERGKAGDRVQKGDRPTLRFPLFLQHLHK